MSLLILSHAGDRGAAILYKHLIKNEIPCRLIIDQDLVWAKEWLITLSEEGFHSYFKLQNNKLIIPERFKYIYCRLRTFLLDNFRSYEDCSYASMEFQAMISGCLAFMSERMINPVHPVYLSMPTRNPLVFYDHFRNAGLPVVETFYNSASDKDKMMSKFKSGKTSVDQGIPGIAEEPSSNEFSWATVINRKTIGPLGYLFQKQLNRLREITQMNVLKVFFQRTQKKKWGAIYFTGVLDFSDEEELGCFTDYISAVN